MILAAFAGGAAQRWYKPESWSEHDERVDIRGVRTLIPGWTDSTKKLFLVAWRAHADEWVSFIGKISCGSQPRTRSRRRWKATTCKSC
jgi:hypothetical protein